MTEENAKKDIEVGQLTADGVYAGLTPDGKQQIFAMPKDLDVTLSFNKAVKAVKKLNTDKDNNLDHNDWQIGSLDVMRVLQKNQNKGSLKGTFNTNDEGPGFVLPMLYWASTQGCLLPGYMRSVRFLGGNEDWNFKVFSQLSCRPVRLVPVPA